MKTDSVTDLRPVSALPHGGQSLLRRSLGGLFDALVHDVTGMVARRRDWNLMVIAAPDGFELFHRDREAANKVAAVSNELSDADLAVLREAKPAQIQRDTTVLRLATDKVIIRKVVLPGAAADFVPAIIRNKIERLAPWPLKEALFAYRIEANEGATAQIQATVAITGRRMVDGILARLAKAGIVPGQVEFAEGAREEDPIVLLSTGSDLEQKVAKGLRSGVLGLVSVLVLVAAVTAISVATMWHDLAAAEARIVELKAKLAVTEAADRAPGASAVRDKAILRKETERSLSAIFLALTRAIPDESWLIDLSYRRSELTVTGRSESVPPLIEALESGPIFADVNFAAPTRRNADDGAAAFSIRMTVPPGRGDAP
jgi:general secretion pathway protein L